MSWTDGDGLERGGDCNECGQPVEEEHHAYCMDCWRAQNGWELPDRSALEAQHQEREAAVRLRLLERVADLERQVEELREQALEPEAVVALVALVASIEKRVERLELHGSLRDRGMAA
jgi:hypothetical protein